MGTISETSARPLAIGDALFTNVQQRELAKLTSAGLVTQWRVGNQTHYQANPSSPVFEELRTLIPTTSGLVDVLRSALAPRAAEVSLAFVFGSIAKRVLSAHDELYVYDITPLT